MVRTLTIKANPQSQRIAAKSLKYIVIIINKIINSDLHF